MKDLKVLRKQLREIIFGTETKAGKLFDLILISAIALSVFVIMLDSVTFIKADFNPWFIKIEWVFTILFTIEYGLRIFSSKKRLRYIFSFFGIIDLLSILPTYLSIFLLNSHYFIVIRVLRTIRIFRILKLVKYMTEANYLAQSIKRSTRKIIVFLFSVFLTTIIFGSIMYIIEGAENGFTSVPRSVYWAIVTMTTVGYGDISPKTNIGQTIAAVIMIIGYSVIAVPTGIISAEMTKNYSLKNKVYSSTDLFCSHCRLHEEDTQATYCKYCGKELI